MQIQVTIMVSQFIYDIYTNAAKILGDCSTEQAMSGALQAYVQYLFEDMQSSGELSHDTPQLDMPNL